MPRLRTVALVAGVTLVGVAAVRRHLHGGGSAHQADGGVLMADATQYDVISRLLLGGFYASVAADVAVGAQAGARVLEVGCGPGNLARRMAGDHGLRVVGLDLDPAMVERARAGLRHDSAPQLEFVVGDVAALPFGDAEFDIVVSTLSLHHWSDPQIASGEIRRVLRPGGRALVWDIRPGVVPMHRHAPDPAPALAGPALRLVGVTPWRWPWRAALTQRLEFVPEDQPTDEPG